MNMFIFHEDPGTDKSGDNGGDDTDQGEGGWEH